MNLLSPRTKKAQNALPLHQESVLSLSVSLSHPSLPFLHFHGVTTGANGANTEVTGAALFAAGGKTRVALECRGKKGRCATFAASIICRPFFALLLRSGAACRVNCSAGTVAASPRPHESRGRAALTFPAGSEGGLVSVRPSCSHVSFSCWM